VLQVIAQVTSTVTPLANQFPLPRPAQGQDPQCNATYTCWSINILPFIEQGPLYQQYKPNLSNQDPANAPVVQTYIQTYACPADSTGDFTAIMPEVGPASNQTAQFSVNVAGTDTPGNSDPNAPPCGPPGAGSRGKAIRLSASVSDSLMHSPAAACVDRIGTLYQPPARRARTRPHVW